MTTGLEYTEVYTDNNSGVSPCGGRTAWRRSSRAIRAQPIFSISCARSRKQGEHGKAFAYKTVNSDVLAFICRRASGMTLSDLLSERIWMPMGAEEDAHYHVDRIGTESGGGGLSTTLRDLARFGETIRNHGRFNGRQIVPSTSGRGHRPRRRSREVQAGRLHHFAWRLLPEPVVGDAQCARRLLWRAVFTGRASISIRRLRW